MQTGTMPPFWEEQKQTKRRPETVEDDGPAKKKMEKPRLCGKSIQMALGLQGGYSSLGFAMVLMNSNIHHDAEKARAVVYPRQLQLSVKQNMLTQLDGLERLLMEH
ncbi:unnamed protein product [Caretta caretta]